MTGKSSRNAIASFDKAVEIKPDDHQAYALQGNIEQAIANLQKAISLNPEYREKAKTNSDFDSIREDERFQALIQREEL